MLRLFLVLFCMVAIPTARLTFATCTPSCEVSKTTLPIAVVSLDPCSYDGVVSGPYATVWRGNYCDGAEGTGTHAGVDLGLTTGTTVHSIAQGRVVKTYNKKATQCQLICYPNGKFRTCDCNQKSDNTCRAGRSTSSRDNSDNGNFGKHVVVEHIIDGADGACVGGRCSGGISADRQCSTTQDCTTARYYSVYAHLATVKVGLGDLVSCGDPVGTLDTTGCASGPHLHFQLDREFDRKDGQLIPHPAQQCGGSKCGTSLDSSYFPGGDKCQATTLSPIAALRDLDQDGIPAADGDCDDTNSDVHPGATENCSNGVDDDCNGQVDAMDSACQGPPILTDNFDSYTSGSFPSSGGWIQYTPTVNIDGSQSVSSPKSLGCFGTQGLGAFAYHGLTVPGGTSILVAETWVRPTRNDSVNMTLRLGTDCGGGPGVTFRLNGEIHGNDVLSGSTLLSGTYAANTWTKVRVELNLSTRSYTAFLNGVNIGSLQAHPGGTPSVICIGADNNISGGTGGGTTVYFADLRVQALP